ncbi:hypothetical protein OG393_06975 [Streptomyces sp. NBC_01216]|uniref:hypothetical protein n=1 Tax=Streptomyces sp. NBC_01216 TaxID=2903778 RepID=UPI002E161D1E|nr:hypothetical protein OG393_06975 [Streptomyces sp. NBC_01216]
MPSTEVSSGREALAAFVSVGVPLGRTGEEARGGRNGSRETAGRGLGVHGESGWTTLS